MLALRSVEQIPMDDDGLRVDLVEEALQAVEGRTLASSGLAGMMGREAPAWDALLADARYGRAQARIGEVPVSTHDAGVTSGANDEANAT